MNRVSTINLACPICKVELIAQHQSYLCNRCGREYFCTESIPDLRVPTQITPDAEQTLVQELIEKYPFTEFQDMALLRVKSRQTTEQRKQKFANYNRTIKERSTRFHSMFTRRIEQQWKISNRHIALDIGCGIGPGILALAKEYDLVVGLDIHLSALLVAKKLIENEGLDNVILIQGSALALPFADQQFDYIMAINVLEHIFEPDVTIAEVHRTLTIEGIFGADSRNRYDLFFPEPHVGLRWLGFLPRRWMEPYVQWRMGVNYDHTHLLSYWDLKRAAVRSFGQNWRVVLPDITAYGIESPLIHKLVEWANNSWVKGWIRHLSPTHLLLTRRSIKG